MFMNLVYFICDRSGPKKKEGFKIFLLMLFKKLFCVCVCSLVCTRINAFPYQLTDILANEINCHLHCHN